MSVETTKPFPIPRRWVRWVGGLLVVVALCGGLLFRVHWVNQRSAAAVARLREVAGVGDVMSTPFPWARFVPARFQSLIPQRRVPHQVVFHSGIQNPGQYLRDIPPQDLGYLTFIQSELTPEDVDVLTQFPNLFVLRMSECQLAEGTLRSLKNLPTLSELVVWTCTLSSTETIDYAKLPNLHFLHLTGSNASDSLLRGMADHPRLTWLHLDGTAVTDEGLREIRRLPRLQRLHLGKTQVTGIGLAELDSPVTQLNLVGTRADDRAMTAIARLSSLESLDLARTKITVVGIRHLHQLPVLSDLVLDRCDVGDEALEPLSAFPQPIRWSAISTRMTRQQSKDAPQRPL